jgi:Anti-sigma-K factor rskA
VTSPSAPEQSSQADRPVLTGSGPPDTDALLQRAVSSRKAPATGTWRGVALASVAAAVGAIAASVTSFALMNRELDEERHQAAEVAAVLVAPDAEVGTADVTGGGRVSVVMSDALGDAVVVLDDPPEISVELAYQLWYVGDEIRSAGVLGSSVDTTTVLLRDVEGADAVALSVEPSGGSDQPTTDPITAVPLQ